jgi:hypothetical protein
MVGAATELERVLGELGETVFEPLKEEQEEGATETMMEKQFNAFNETLVNFMKGSVSNLSQHPLPTHLMYAKFAREETILP